MPFIADFSVGDTSGLLRDILSIECSRARSDARVLVRPGESNRKRRSSFGDILLVRAFHTRCHVLCSRSQLRKSVFMQLSDFSLFAHPPRKQARDYRRSLSSSCPSLKSLAMLLRVASSQGRGIPRIAITATQQVHRFSKRAIRIFVAHVAVPARLPEKRLRIY